MKLLWIGDAVSHTGFARVTHNVLERLRHDWEVLCLGINYHGDPHTYPYPIYPARVSPNQDMWGINRFEQMYEYLKPDVILILNDPWVVEKFIGVPGFEKVRKRCPIVAYMPVDGMNMHNGTAEALNKLSLAIWYTHFGKSVAEVAGYTESSIIIPHGVNRELYKGMDKNEARRRQNFGKELVKDAYIVGNVNRNAPRKRLDLTVRYFARWIKEEKIDNAYLYLHCAQQDIGWDLEQLAWYFAMPPGRFIVPSSNITSTVGLFETGMPIVYSSFDLQISTTMGEGWGLTTMEGMSCGIPQVVPDFAALGEWPRTGVRYVKCDRPDATAGNLNTLCAAPNEDEFVTTLARLYNMPEEREDLRNAALRLVSNPKYTWDAVAKQFHDALLGIASMGYWPKALSQHRVKANAH